jgi:hypothetical protein
MSLRDFTEQEIVKELRNRRKARRKKKSTILGHPEKKQGESFVRDGHEYLPPEKKFERRVEIFRNAGGEVAIFDGIVEEIQPASCQGCSETHLIGFFEGEWSHPKSHGERRCDCAACALFVCRPWHKRHHNRETKFLQREPAR